MKGNEIDRIRQKWAILIFSFEIIHVGIRNALGDAFDCSLSVAEELVCISDDCKEGEFHVFDSSNRLKNVFDVITIGSVVVLVHPETINGEK